MISQNFETDGGGGVRHVASVIVPTRHTTWLSPTTGDIHRLVNAYSGTTISIHVYGAAFSRVCRTRYEYPATEAGSIPQAASNGILTPLLTANS